MSGQKHSIKKSAFRSCLKKEYQKSFDWQAWVRDIWRDYFNSGCKSYEIRGFYTKDGNPVVLDYDILPARR